jgi:adenylate kinase family enzyme
MANILIFGNSGSGKSTLAKQLSTADQCAHLDLDILAWLPTTPLQRAPQAVSNEKIQAFMAANKHWVIEGCYADLLEMASAQANEIIFIDLPVFQCVQNAKNRPWEPHKYESKAAQDKNLDMLVQWIERYPLRNDVFSLDAHQRFYDNFKGQKTRYISNER